MRDLPPPPGGHGRAVVRVVDALLARLLVEPLNSFLTVEHRTAYDDESWLVWVSSALLGPNCGARRVVLEDGGRSLHFRPDRDV